MESDFLTFKNAQRKELIDELISLSKQHFVHLFKHIFETTVKSNVYPEKLLREFQDNLSKTKNWNNIEIKDISNSFPDILNLINNIFNLNRQLFPNESELITDHDFDNKERFIKYTCLDIAREIWKKPFLFHEISKQLNYCNNDECVDKIITNCIKTFIRRQSNLLNIYTKDEDHISNKLANGLNIHTSNPKEITTDLDSKNDKLENILLNKPENYDSENDKLKPQILEKADDGVADLFDKKNVDDNDNSIDKNVENDTENKNEQLKNNDEDIGDNLYHNKDKDKEEAAKQIPANIEKTNSSEKDNDNGTKDIFKNYIPFSNNTSRRDSLISSISLSSSSSSNKSSNNKENSLLNKKLNKLILKQQKKKNQQRKKKKHINKLLKEMVKKKIKRQKLE